MIIQLDKDFEINITPNKIRIMPKIEYVLSCSLNKKNETIRLNKKTSPI